LASESKREERDREGKDQEAGLGESMKWEEEEKVGGYVRWWWW
jgi:hypothetical protein